MLNDPLTEVGPALVGFRVGRLVGLGIEDISAAEVGPKDPGDFGPAHEFMDREELE